jgi:tetratricopeptide (TPR) repeat protein
MTPAEAPSRNVWLSAVLPASALLVILVLVYIPALRGGFIWDDDDHFTANPHLVGVDGLVTIWTSTKAIYYPLTLTTWWVMRQLFDLWPFPYHAITLFLHGANALLFIALLRRLAIPGAWLAGALFALHPVHVESVAWATELKNTQSGLFFLLALHAWLTSEERREASAPWKSAWVLAILAAIAAILSKPSTVPLPGVLLVLARWRTTRLTPGDFLRTIPFMLLAILSALWTIYEQKHHSNAKGPEWDQSFVERLLIAGKAFWFYIGKFLWPAELVFIYPRWDLSQATPLWHLGWLAAVATPLLCIYRCLYQKRELTRHLATIILLYGGLLFPILGFFNVYFFRFSFVADHFAYLASLPLLAGAGALAARVVGLFDREFRTPAWMLLALLPLACAVQSHRETHKYADEETLWRVTLARNPNAWIGWNNLGYELTRQGRFEEALPLFQAAIALKPNYEEAHNNLGFALLELGRPEAAIAPLREAIRHREPYPDALLNLGNALAGVGQLEEAATLYEQVIILLPSDADAHLNFGSILAARGEITRAEAHLARSVQLDPANTKATERLAIIRSRLANR